jgi:hypothetical protein
VVGVGLVAKWPGAAVPQEKATEANSIYARELLRQVVGVGSELKIGDWIKADLM